MTTNQVSDNIETGQIFGYNYLAVKAHNGDFPKLANTLIILLDTKAILADREVKKWTAEDFQDCLENLTDCDFSRMAEAGEFDEVS